MAKALKVVGTIASAVALVSSVLLGPTNPVTVIAATVAAVANTGSALLQKKPPARGSVSQVLIQTDAVSPYAMGEGLFAGALRHQAGYGATLKKVPNPYWGEVIVYSHGGPIEEITPYVDQGPVGGYYAGFLYTASQLGLCPQAAALVPNFAGFTGWDATSKLSGQAAILWNYKFDKDGKIFASGRPPTAAFGRWVKCYDPRLDSTYPGGAGAHRIDNEATWAWSERAGLHGLTYALGRHQNGKFVLGMDLPPDAIAIEDFVELANVEDANAWRMFGVVYEPGERELRWNNLKDIVGAAGASPFTSGGKLRLRIRAPKVALATVTENDLGEDRVEITAMRTLAERVNSIVGKYRSPAHDWELVDAEAVTVGAYVTEDGELLERVVAYNFVKDVTQAAQLAAYDLVDGRELGPIVLPLKPAWRWVRPGDCLHLALPLRGLDHDAIVLTRTIDPGTMKVTLTFETESPAKHAYALGLTGTAPPTPALGQTAAQRDGIAAAAMETPGVSFFDPAPFEVQANSAGATTTELAGGAVKRTILVYKGGELQTAGVTVGAEVESPDAAIDATVAVVAGAVGVTLDKADASGSVVVPVTFEGATYDRTIVVKRTMAAPVSGGGGGADPFIDSTWTNIGTTGNVQVTDTGAQILSNASGELQWSFISSYTGIGSAVIGPEYSTDGSTWFDFAAEVAGSAAFSGEPGFVMADGLKTGLTASTVYYIRLIARRSGGSGTLSWSDPNFTVNQP